MQAPKAISRFLPTLTEVVTPVVPSTEVVSAQSPAPPVQIQTPWTEDAQVAQVMERLLPDLELQLQKALRQSLQAQLERLLPAVMLDMEAAVRSAVRVAATKSQDADTS